MSDEMETHDVAIVVYMRAPGVDARDAADRAELALRRAVRADGRSSVLVDDGRDGPSGTGAEMPVVDLMEVGVAARNGYLWVRPTSLAARDRGFA